MKHEILLLRLSYWLGTIIDTVGGISMIFPQVFAVMEGVSSFSPGSDYLFAMGMGASLKFGWTVLLLWGDQKPLERKGILLITVFPVIVGIYINRLYEIASGFLSLGTSVLYLIVPIILCVIFIGSYFYAAHKAEE